MENFPQRLEKTIAQSGLSRGDFAKRSRVGESALAKWLSGKLTPKSEQLYALARAGNVTMEWLLSGAGPKTPPDASGELTRALAKASDLMGKTDEEKQAWFEGVMDHKTALLNEILDLRDEVRRLENIIAKARSALSGGTEEKAQESRHPKSKRGKRKQPTPPKP